MRILLCGTHELDVEAVLLDMDGTVTHVTDEINRTATEQALAEYGVALRPESYRIARGRSREEGIRLLLEAHDRSDLLNELEAIASCKETAARELREKLGPKDVPDEDRRILDAMRAAGLRLAIGSSSRNALDTLNRLGLTRYFDAIVTGNERKEKAAIWQLAVDSLGTKANSVFVVEDAQVGIDAAVAIGVPFSVAVGDDGTVNATLKLPRLSDLQVEQG